MWNPPIKAPSQPKETRMDPFQHFMNSPMMKQSLEQFTYMTGLGEEMYWPVMGGVILAVSSLQVLLL